MITFPSLLSSRNAHQGCPKPVGRYWPLKEPATTHLPTHSTPALGPSWVWLRCVSIKSGQHCLCLLSWVPWGQPSAHAYPELNSPLNNLPLRESGGHGPWPCALPLGPSTSTRPDLAPRELVLGPAWDSFPTRGGDQGAGAGQDGTRYPHSHRWGGSGSRERSSGWLRLTQKEVRFLTAPMSSIRLMARASWDTLWPDPAMDLSVICS